MKKEKLIVHGGASNIKGLSPLLEEKQKAVERACEAVAGLTGMSAVDCVEKAAAALEDEAALNAGYGSVVQMDGRIRMDAAICTSESRYGGIIQIENVKNPICVARRLMEHDYHSLLSGAGAEQFAREEGFPSVSPMTESAMKAWLEARGDFEKLTYEALTAESNEINVRKLSTIGAVAIDKDGRLAAACSTGGTKFCYPGRVGDTPIFGAGLYCSPHIAIACTGEGDKILRRLTARRVEDEYLRHGNLQKALDTAINDLFTAEKGYGGIIALTAGGETGFVHNTSFMAVTETGARL